MNLSSTIKSASKTVTPPLIVGVLTIVVWYLSIDIFDLPVYQLPAPHQILQAGFAESKTLLSGTLQTAIACVLGFVISAVVAALMALALASSRWAYNGIYPYILILKMTPVIVLAPIITLSFGQGLTSITIITFLICFFPIVANTTAGLISVEKGYVDLFKVYGADTRQSLLYLQIPNAMPYYLTGLKVSAALTPIGALYGDTIAGMGSGSEAGLGFVVVIFSTQLKIPALYAAAFTACIIGFTFVGFVSWLHWKLLHKWHSFYTFQDE